MIDCLIYFGIFVFVFILNWAAMRQKRPILRSIFVLMSFLVLLAFVGFRYNVGADYDNYLKAYGEIANTPWEKLPSLRMELLVAAIFKVCSYVLSDAKLIFVVLGFLLLWPIYKVNKLYDYKYLAYSVLAYCVLFLPFGMNGMRQSIAMGFILLAYVYMLKNRTKCSVASFVAAVLFHTTSLIVLPYLVIIYASQRKNVVFTTLSVIASIIIIVMVLFFLNGLLIDNGITQYDYMLGSIDVEKISFTSSIAYLPIVLMIVLLGKRADKELKNEIMVFENLTISGIVFRAIGTAAKYLSRFGLFFMMPIVVLMPELIQGIPQKNTRLLVKGLFVTYLVAIFYVQYSVLGWQGIIPYQTWVFGGIS